MRTPATRTLLRGLVVASLLAVAACGDDDGAEPAQDDEAATTEAGTADGTTGDGADATGEDATGEDATDTDTEAAADGTTSTLLPPGEPDPVFCSEVGAGLEELDELLRSGDAGDDEELRQQAAAIFEDVEPPEEIASDWEAVMEPLIGAGFEPPDDDDPEAMDAYAEELAAYQDSAERVEAYLRERCELASGLTPGSP
jgi:hypothetical protein